MNHPHGNSCGNSINGKANKARRRENAYARLDEWNKLSLKEKLAKLPAEGAKRQRARYEAQLAKQSEQGAEKQAKKKDRTQKAAEQLITQRTVNE